jgi:hypothetical protein
MDIISPDDRKRNRNNGNVYTPPFVDHKGCEIANDYLGRQCRCLDSCPFARCVLELSEVDMDGIRKWRSLLKVYELAGRNMSNLKISRAVGVSRHRIAEWLAKRDFYEWFLRRPITERI